MGREVRRVASTWLHPLCCEDGEYEPLDADCMPEESKGDWYMMYETCTEGTPMSPAFQTPEELARWLVENKASAFGNQEASYEAWLATIKRGWAVSAVIGPRGMQSGVEGLKDMDAKGHGQ